MNATKVVRSYIKGIYGATIKCSKDLAVSVCESGRIGLGYRKFIKFGYPRFWVDEYCIIWECRSDPKIPDPTRARNIGYSHTISCQLI